MPEPLPDYDMRQTAPPPPPLDPPPPTPPPPPPPSTELQEAVEATTPKRLAAPTVTEVRVTARQATYDDQANRSTTVEVQLLATPDPVHPASESVDRLWAAANAKVQQYLRES